MMISRPLLIAVLAVVALAAAVLVLCLYFGAVSSGHSKGSARSSSCLGNLKQIVFAALEYSADHDGKLMLRDSWMDSCEPYGKLSDIDGKWRFRCQGLTIDETAPKNAYGHAYNSVLSARAVKHFDKPESVLFAYDSINLARNASDPVSSLPDPPRDYGNGIRRNSVVFLDGHGERLE